MTRLWILILKGLRRLIRGPVSAKLPAREMDARGLYRIRRSIRNVMQVGPFKVPVTVGGYRLVTEPAILERPTPRGGHFRTFGGIGLHRKRRDILEKL